MKRSTQVLLALGFAIAILQVTSIGFMLFDIAPMPVVVGLKAALSGCIAAFVVMGARRVRGASS